MGTVMYAFNDFGSSFVIHDRDGEEARSGLVLKLEIGTTTTVHTDPDANNGLQKGSKVKFLNLVGTESLNSTSESADEGPFFDVVDASATSFTVAVDSSSMPAYVRGGYFYEVKQDSVVEYQPLDSFLGRVGDAGVLEAESVFNTTNFERPAQLHALLQGLWAARPADKWGSNAPIVAPEAVLQAAMDSFAAPGTALSDADRRTLSNAVATAHGQVVATASILGGAVAQEVIKAASGRFTPLKQFLYLDIASALPEELAADRQPQGSRYDSQIAVFGAAMQQKLQDSKVFLVGSGALGCEFLKCFAAMGLACGEQGEVVVTDMDSIEKSNLNRQFLFRPRHVGHMKSTVAATAAIEINGDLKVRSMDQKVAPETEDIFDAAFWEALTFVVPALDNVHARKYVDGKCVEHKLAMLESGTQGTKCHTMMCLPGKSVNYGSVQDPPEQGIPVCTLKSFPTLVEHTLQWARDEFEASFHNAPAEANQYLSNEAYYEEVCQQRNEKVVRLRDAYGSLVEYAPTTFADCVKFARVRFERIFSHNVRDLLHQHPLDKVDDEGHSFWTAKKRPPAPADFSWDNKHHRSFLVAGANLHARVYGLPTVADSPENAAEYVAALEAAAAAVPTWTPSGTRIAATEEEAAELAKAADAADDLDAEAERLHGELPAKDAFVTAAGLKALLPEDFEKDDDGNHHMDFIHAAGMIRGMQYGIPEKTRMESKKIVGRIIPAIATTTAMTVGFVVAEMYKVLRGAPLESFTEWNANLAINSFASFEPDPCSAVELKGERYTLWDTLDIGAEEGEPVTFGHLVQWFKQRDLRLMSVSTGALSLWSDDLEVPVAELEAAAEGSDADSDAAGEVEEFTESLEDTVLEVLNADPETAVPEGTPYVLVQVEAWDLAQGGADESTAVQVPTVRVLLTDADFE